jgi:ABC-type bacteriocin/lantibiotic exporter with double-glycine peptidase domain
MNIRRRKFLAAAGLGGIFLFSVLILAAATVVSSPDGLKNFSAWRMGAEYIGSQGVVLQDKRNNCGPAALKMVFDHYGIPSTLTEIEQRVDLSEKGSSMLALKEMAELKGLKAEGWRYTLEDFLRAPLPAIVFVHGDHFAVVDSVTETGEIVMRDPALGKLRLPAEKLSRIWNGETLVFRTRAQEGSMTEQSLTRNSILEPQN